jgi:hypothetical protein
VIIVSGDGMKQFGFENAMLGTGMHEMTVKCGKNDR